MPAVVRGGRRQSSAKGGARGSPSGRAAEIGRLDMSPRVVAATLVVGVGILAAVLATGARAERISAAVTERFDAVTTGMGLKVRQVHVTGASPEAAAAVRAAVGVHADQPIVSLDLAAVRDRVQSVGWVKEARVVRLLPDTLIVDVKEHDRLAVWQVGGKAHVIDAQGLVIEGADAGRYPRLPLVVGKGADQAASDVLPLLAQRPRLMAKIDALVRVDERRWDLRLKDGALIQLPAVDQESALIRLDALDQRERLLDLGFARIDLRTPEEVAVRPSEGAV
ncbi:cell division protein FtsQ/DivIB [Brevundimonas naejangsanensis]|uniref:cell division protein FtsQ/DivIB n=1 Tax=Brevundimonas naejangsanensis TaxID=588932 RepID=UPI0026F2C955|nr:cell division protein FtsQ/DivIB [Brevundimonas naejangsanensis]